jgi:ferredoxin
MKIPVVELSDCKVCGVCVEACPEVFRLNEAGYIEVIDLAGYPEKDVNEAIKHCPADCISWLDELKAEDTKLKS